MIRPNDNLWWGCRQNNTIQNLTSYPNTVCCLKRAAEAEVCLPSTLHPWLSSIQGLCWCSAVAAAASVRMGKVWKLFCLFQLATFPLPLSLLPLSLCCPRPSASLFLSLSNWVGLSGILVAYTYTAQLSMAPSEQSYSVEKFHHLSTQVWLYYWKEILRGTPKISGATFA